MEERINPVIVTDPVTGETYELDFSRSTVLFAEDRGFKIDEVLDYPAKMLPLLFWYALRKNHKSIAQNKAEEILLDHLHGLSIGKVRNIIELYNQARFANVLVLDEDDEKNE